MTKILNGGIGGTMEGGILDDSWEFVISERGTFVSGREILLSEVEWK